MRSVDRASPTDMVSLASDTVAAPMQVGAVIVLAADQPPDLAAIEAAIGQRIQAIPRLRQRLVRLPLGYGRPIWVDDTKFDIARHLRRIACPLPGDEQALLHLTATLVTSPLPRSRPLWSATLVTGLTDNKIALVLVFHHVLADGIGGLAVLASLVDGAPAAGPTLFPAGGPSRRELAVDAWTTRLHAASRLPQFPGTARSAFTELVAKPAAAESCSLNEPTGPRRQLAVVRTDLARLREATHQCGGTVNDALLAAVAGALHTLLAGRGEHIDTLVMSIPVSARRSATSAELGNNTGVMQVAVPATGDARWRTSQIATIIQSRKGPAPAAMVDPGFRALGALGILGWVINHQRMVHTFVTNLHGPDQPVTLGGAKVSAVIPVSATTGNVTLAFAALSYAGTLTVTVIADPDHVPDMSVLTDALQAELDTLTSGSRSDRAAQ